MTHAKIIKETSTVVPCDDLIDTLKLDKALLKRRGNNYSIQFIDEHAFEQVNFLSMKIGFEGKHLDVIKNGFDTLGLINKFQRLEDSGESWLVSSSSSTISKSGLDEISDTISSDINKVKQWFVTGFYALKIIIILLTFLVILSLILYCCVRCKHAKFYKTTKSRFKLEDAKRNEIELKPIYKPSNKPITTYTVKSDEVVIQEIIDKNKLNDVNETS